MRITVLAASTTPYTIPAESGSGVPYPKKCNSPVLASFLGCAVKQLANCLSKTHGPSVCSNGSEISIGRCASSSASKSPPCQLTFVLAQPSLHSAPDSPDELTPNSKVR